MKVTLDKVEFEPSPNMIGDRLQPELLAPSKGKRLLYMGEPMPDDLERIKKITNNYDWEATEWYVVPFRASDNLVNRSQRVWHPNVLEQMPNQFIGRPLLKDHSWYSVDESIGIIFDSFIADDVATEEIINSGDRGLLNKKIISSQGYKSVYVMVAIHASMPVEINAIATMRFDKCSTGGILSDMDMYCPNCSEIHGREVSFFEQDERGKYICPHEMPGGYGYEENSLVADYIILDGIFDAIELSVCVSGNLPAAGVVRA